MKFTYAFPLLALLSCTANTPEADPLHAAVSGWLKANVHDPAKYEPVRWGKAEAFTRRDSLKEKLRPMIDDMNTYTTQKGYIDKALASVAFTDTTRIGTRLTHAYRHTNKFGALVLDSAEFVLYKNGKVQPL